MIDPHLAQVAQIAWSPDRSLVGAEGACELVFARPASALVGRSLSELLEISEEKAAELDVLARSGQGAPVFLPASREGGRVCLRLMLGHKDGTALAAVQELQGLLAGAPPVQISRLSSSLSHEIRNPLSSVKMAVQTLARNTGLSERDQRRLVIANREVRTMERMLWLLSEYGREAAPKVEPLSLRSLLQEAAGLVENELAERNIKVEIDEEPSVPRVKADAARLRPVLSQIILNVAMGLAQGQAVPIKIMTGAGGGAVVSIVDPSAALPPEERAQLFEPFGSMLARGAGLSLAALNRVMLCHGGTVSAEGTASPGAVYTLTFPG